MADLTFDEWFSPRDEQEHELEELLREAWERGALCAFEALVDRGYIDPSYAGIAHKGIADLLPETE